MEVEVFRSYRNSLNSHRVSLQFQRHVGMNICIEIEVRTVTHIFSVLGLV